jgi:hypothetical protein
VLSASESATIYYTLDGSTPTTSSTSAAAPATIAVPSSLTLKYFAVDAAGNASSIVSQAYRIGALNLTQTPALLGNVNTPTFAFDDAVANSTFQCSLGLQSAADVLTPCSSPVTYPKQADGAYRFTVQDSAGDSVAYLFTIDTTPPVVSVTQNPSNPDASSTATFAWTANEAGTTFQCAFGPATAPAAATACTSPASYTGLSDGSYLFTLQATDAAGNKATLFSYPFTVKAVVAPSITQAPTASLLGLSTGQATGGAPVVTAGPLTADATKGVPVTISWAGTACISGAVNCNVDHYVLQESVNNLAFSTVTLANPTATSIVRSLRVSPTNNSQPATTYRYQVQAVDKLGNASPVGQGPVFTVPDTDNSFNTSFSGSWTGVNLVGAFGGSVQQSSTANSTANPANPQTVTSLALVSTLGPDRGIAQIKVDGTVVATVDLYSATQQTAQVVWAENGLAAGKTHQVQLVATANKNPASTSAKVDYDAILALK